MLHATNPTFVTAQISFFYRHVSLQVDVHCAALPQAL